VLVIFHLLVWRSLFQLRNYFWSHIVHFLIYYFGWRVSTILYIHNFSQNLLKDVSKEIGLKLVIFVLSPFLFKVFISANFNQEGKISDKSDLLHMYVKGDVMKGVLTFRIFIGIPSHQWEVWDFSDWYFFLFLCVLYILVSCLNRGA
jgi:hypothetical protein